MSAPLLRRVVPAVSIFAFALLAADGARVSVRGWSQPPDRPLAAAVRSGPETMRIRNLTSASWADCQLMIHGGYAPPPFTLPAHATVRLPYQLFRVGESPLPVDEGFSRAFQGTSLECTDAHNVRQRATMY